MFRKFVKNINWMVDPPSNDHDKDEVLESPEFLIKYGVITTKWKLRYYYNGV